MIQDKFYHNLINLLDNKHFDIKAKQSTKELVKILKINTYPAFIVGNGGSAAIASHVAEDFTKLAKIPMKTYNDVSLISCLANDYGWENWIKKAVEFYETKTTVGIFISASGESKNIINGCKQANIQDIFTVTLSGFDKDNTLNTLGNINYWVPSNSYNTVELLHETWLLSICEILNKK